MPVNFSFLLLSSTPQHAQCQWEYPLEMFNISHLKVAGSLSTWKERTGWEGGAPGTQSEAERRLLWFESRPEQSTWTLTQLSLAWAHTANGSGKETYESVGKIESSGMREPCSLTGSNTCLSHLMTWNDFLRAVSRQRTAGRPGGRLTQVQVVFQPSAWKIYQANHLHLLGRQCR